MTDRQPFSKISNCSLKSKIKPTPCHGGVKFLLRRAIEAEARGTFRLFLLCMAATKNGLFLLAYHYINICICFKNTQKNLPGCPPAGTTYSVVKIILFPLKNQNNNNQNNQKNIEQVSGS
jgi:hypothetical protein